jgi:Asp-tRNA(Asn)/Glu-tRNA(Gln) amidotransferase A subunit family amidase
MQNAVETAARAAEKAGASVREVSLPPIMEDAFRMHPTLQNYEAARALAFEYDRHREQLPKLLRALLDDANKITNETYDDARRTTKRARRAYTDLMTDFDVIITPSATGAAPAGLASTGDAKFNRLWTLIGPPCINVTGMMDENNLPLGIQIVGRFGRDREALEAAHSVEQAIAQR